MLTPLVLRRARLAGTSSDPVTLMIDDGRVRFGGGAPAGAEVVDLDGRTVLPGLWDHHVHAEQWALLRSWVDLTACGSPAEVVTAVRARLASGTPDYGLPLVGYGYRDGTWAERPHRDRLDAVSRELPLVMVGWDLHQAWCNTAALRRYGHALEGDGADHDGILREDDWLPVADDLRRVPDAVLDGWVATATGAAAARGVVGLVDFESSDTHAAWGRRAAAGPLSVRVRAAVWPDFLDAAIAAGRRTGEPLPGTGGLVTMGPLKVISDGSLNTRTAYCDDAYPGEPENHGRLVVPPSQLVPLMDRATRHGIGCAIHAIGDHAAALALDAFAAVGAVGSIEHAQLLRREDLARFAALGVVASVQPEHAVDDVEVAERYWADRLDRAFPYADLHRAGVRLVLGSDAPVAPLDPWVSLAAAVWRSRDEAAPWHPEQQLARTVALAASTATGRTTPADGDVADLVITDVDPLTATPAALRKAPVAGTLLAGRWTYRNGV